MQSDLGLVPVAWRHRGPRGGWITTETKQAWSEQPLYDAAAIERLVAERDEARKALTTIAGVVEKSVRANGDEAFTLHLKGTTYTGPAVEFLGYALSSLGKLARQALGDTL